MAVERLELPMPASRSAPLSSSRQTVGLKADVLTAYNKENVALRKSDSVVLHGRAACHQHSG